MLAVRTDPTTAPGVLRVDDIPEPVPEPGEALVAFEGSALNPADRKIRDGLIIPRAGRAPWTLGWDLVGRVRAGGELPAGTRVLALIAMAGHGGGTWSESVAVPAHAMTPLPEEVDAEIAAQLPLTGTTAMQAIADAGPGDEEVLVVGAGGAVGALVVQLLVAAGRPVRGLVRDPERVAPHVRATGIPLRSARMPGTAPAAVVIDAAGLGDGSLVRPGGRYVTVVPGCEPTALPDGATGTVVRVTPSGDRLAELIEGLLAGRIRVPGALAFALADAPQAFEALNGANGRRIVLRGIRSAAPRPGRKTRES